MDRDLIDHLSSAFQASPVAGIVSAYVFGSHVSRLNHRESDLDVGALFDRALYPTRALRFDARIALSAYLARALHAPDVDVVALNDGPPTLTRRVLTEGVRVFCADGEADHVARRTALSRAADLEPFLRRMRRIKLAAIAR